MGLGFTGALTIIGSFREILGNGSIFGFKLTPESFEPITIFILAPGALLTMAILTAIQNKLKLPSATNVPGKESIGCGGDCPHCGGGICTVNREMIASKLNKASENKAADRKPADEDNK